MGFFRPHQSPTTMSSEEQKSSKPAKVQFKGHCACTKGPFHTLAQKATSARTDKHQEYLQQLEYLERLKKYKEKCCKEAAMEKAREQEMEERSRPTQHLVWELSKVQARDDFCSVKQS